MSPTLAAKESISLKVVELGSGIYPGLQHPQIYSFENEDDHSFRGQKAKFVVGARSNKSDAFVEYDSGPE